MARSGASGTGSCRRGVSKTTASPRPHQTRLPGTRVGVLSTVLLSTRVGCSTPVGEQHGRLAGTNKRGFDRYLRPCNTIRCVLGGTIANVTQDSSRDDVQNAGMVVNLGPRLQRTKPETNHPLILTSRPIVNHHIRHLVISQLRSQHAAAQVVEGASPLKLRSSFEWPTRATNTNPQLCPWSPLNNLMGLSPKPISGKTAQPSVR